MKLRNKKTGEIFDYREDIMPFGLGSPFPKSLAELCENWEDATDEPLIKDKKIRRAVRAWYEINFTEKPIYLEDSCTISIDHSPRFEVAKGYYFMTLAKGNPYTIAELCGEEEE